MGLVRQVGLGEGFGSHRFWVGVVGFSRGMGGEVVRVWSWGLGWEVRNLWLVECA